MCEWREPAHPPLPHKQPCPQILGHPQVGGDCVVFSGVTPPYREDYSSHSYPVPNLSISIVRSVSRRLTHGFYKRRAGGAWPPCVPWITPPWDWQHWCWSTALPFTQCDGEQPPPSAAHGRTVFPACGGPYPISRQPPALLAGLPTEDEHVPHV